MIGITGATPMTIFELVKLALDELYAEGTEEDGSGLDKQIKKQMTYLSDSYRRLDQASRRPVSAPQGRATRWRLRRRHAYAYSLR